jgi:hypothetical protein
VRKDQPRKIIFFHHEKSKKLGNRWSYRTAVGTLLGTHIEEHWRGRLLRDYVVEKGFLSLCCVGQGSGVPKSCFMFLRTQ